MKINHVELVQNVAFNSTWFINSLNFKIKQLNENASVNEIVDIKYSISGSEHSALILLNVNESYFDHE